MLTPSGVRAEVLPGASGPSAAGLKPAQTSSLPTAADIPGLQARAEAGEPAAGAAALGASLREAVRQGDEEKIRALLSRGASPYVWLSEDTAAEAAAGDAAAGDDGDSTPPTPLEIAVSGGRRDILQLLLQEGRVGVPSGVVNAALGLAAEQGRRDMVELLLAAGADVNALVTRSGTPLHRAVGAGDVAMAKLLLERGADVNALDSMYQTPLICAVRERHEELATLLLEAGAEVNPSIFRFMTPLREALEGEDVRFVRMLLKAGADVNGHNIRHESPLIWAVQNGNVAMATELLKAGADANAKDSEGDTPLLMMARRLQQDVEEAEDSGRVIIPMAIALLDAGADVNAENAIREGTPLLLAAEAGDSRFVKLLLERGADVKATNHTGNTPLHVATDEETVKALLAAGADLKARNVGLGATPLHMAASRKQGAEAVRLLISAGSELEAPACWGERPLHYAATMAAVDGVKLLLEAGADVNARRTDGGTPLMMAVLLPGRFLVLAGTADSVLTEAAATLETVRVLLAAGADVHFVNNEGYTPLCAAMRMQSELKKALEEESDEEEKERLKMLLETYRPIIEMLRQHGV